MARVRPLKAGTSEEGVVTSLYSVTREKMGWRFAGSFDGYKSRSSRCDSKTSYEVVKSEL
jgi:hypothetical protein